MNSLSLQVYINFDGNCREAVEYYSKVFKTDKPEIMTFGDAPEDPGFSVPEESKNLVMHTQLIISGDIVMFSDTFPGMPLVKGNNISLTVVTDDMDEITEAFNQLKAEGKVEMELQETFWSKYYGSLVDKYGITWQFSMYEH